jgi:hypothetical protein
MKTSKTQTTDSFTAEGYEGHFADLDGYTVGFETYTADADLASLFKGLPDDHCQCPHWGVVLKGKLTYRYTDGSEETIGEGEAYYARPGHTPFLHAGTEVVEFSPTGDLQKTMEVVAKNMESQGATE